MSQPPIITCVGHAALDLIYRVDAIPTRPIKVPATSLALSGGGMAANAACAIASLGGAARFVGPIGDDVFGDLVAAGLRDRGVDIGALVRTAGATTSVSSIIVENGGERLIVNHRGTALEADSPDFAPLLRAASALLCDVRWPAGSSAAFSAAAEARLPAVLDADVAAPDILAELVPQATHVIFSEPGFARWSGTSADARHIHASLQSLVTGRCALAAVTLGERGVVAATLRGIAHVPAFAVAAVETLGAGDVFHGAFTLALAEGSAIDVALRFAAAAAAEKCRRAGGRTALPGRSDVESRLRLA